MNVCQQENSESLMRKVAEGPNEVRMQKGVQQFSIHADPFNDLPEPSSTNLASSWRSSPTLRRFESQ